MWRSIHAIKFIKHLTLVITASPFFANRTQDSYMIKKSLYHKQFQCTHALVLMFFSYILILDLLYVHVDLASLDPLEFRLDLFVRAAQL